MKTSVVEHLMNFVKTSIVEHLMNFVKTSIVEHVHELCEDKRSGTRS